MLAARSSDPTPASHSTPPSGSDISEECRKTCPELELLVQRLRAGDRSAVHEVILRYAGLIHCRFAHRAGPELRRVLDVEDVQAIVALGLDTAVREQRLRASTGSELSAFMAGMTEKALLERVRWFRRLRRMERTVAPVADPPRTPPREALPYSEGDLARAVERVIAEWPEQDRALVRLRLTDTSHAVIAETLAISTVAARQRWKALRIRLIHELR